MRKCVRCSLSRKWEIATCIMEIKIKLNLITIFEQCKPDGRRIRNVCIIEWQSPGKPIIWHVWIIIFLYNFSFHLPWKPFRFSVHAVTSQRLINVSLSITLDRVYCIASQKCVGCGTTHGDFSLMNADWWCHVVNVQNVIYFFIIYLYKYYRSFNLEIIKLKIWNSWLILCITY